MRTSIVVTLFLLSLCVRVFSQNSPGSTPGAGANSALTPTMGIIISTNDAETVWNAFRLANFSATKGDTVTIFLIGKGVEAFGVGTEDFDIKPRADDFISKGGVILACTTCLNLRNMEADPIMKVSSLNDLYAIIKSSKTLLTF